MSQNYENLSKTCPSLQDRLYSLKETTEILGMGLNTLKRKIKAGEVRGYPKKYGKSISYDISKAEILRYVETLKPHQRTPLTGHSAYLEHYLEACVVGGIVNRNPLAESTIERYGFCLREYFKFAESLNVRDVSDAIRLVFQPRGKSVPKHFVKALQSYTKYLYKMGYIGRDLYKDLREVHYSYRSETDTNTITKTELTKIREVADAKGENYRLLVELLINTGLRAGEAAQLKVQDIDLEGRQIAVRHAKGTRKVKRSVEYVGINQTLLGYLESAVTDKKPHEPLLLQPKTGTTWDMGYLEPMTRMGLYNRIKRVCDLAGFPDKSPHSFRSGFITMAALQGVNPTVLQKIARHTKFSMTEQYVRMASDVAVKESQQLEF